MMEWKETTIEAISTKLGDGLHGTPIYSDDGEYFFINGNNLREGKIVVDEKTKRVSLEEFEKYKKALNERTLFVSINGTLGNVAYYNNEKIILGKSACYFNVKQNVCLQFIRYILESRYFKYYIDKFSSGTTIQNLSLKSIREFSFLLPKLEEQQEIAKTLSNLDQKITLLRQQNETLEQIAQTLFKRWFVDFEFPNEDGQPYRSSGGEMVDSELGEIPMGWRVGSLSEIADINIGRTPPRKESEWFTTNKEDIKWISIKDMGNSGVYITQTSEYLTQKAVDKFNIPLIRKGTTILSFKLTVGRVAITVEDMLSNEAIAHVNLNNDYNVPQYSYLLLKSYNYSSLGNTSSIGTAVNSKTIKNMEIIIPNSYVVNAFGVLTNDIFKKILNNTNEIQTLIQLRDNLLPKLMSGEIRVQLGSDVKI